MVHLKFEQLLCSLLFFCVAYAFYTPVDSPQSGIGLGRHWDLGRSQNAPQFSEIGQVSLHRELSDGVGIRRSSSTGSLPDLESIQSQSSEISALFAKRRDAPVELSTVKSVTTSSTFLAKAEPIKSILSYVTSPRSVGSSFKPDPSSTSKPLLVPSEGGLMQDSTAVTSIETNNHTVMSVVFAGNSPEELQVKETGTGSSTEGTLIHHVDIPVVKKQLPPQDSHISARKGATLPDKSEISSSSINDTTEQFTFPSSESAFTTDVRPQKIAPRKGAKPPKIFPRKGVEDKIDDHNSSDPIFIEENDNGPSSTSTGTISTPLSHGPMSNTTPLYGNVAGLPDSVNDSRPTTDTAKLFQMIRLDFPQKESTSPTSSKSSVISPISESSTPKLEEASNVEMKNNLYSNLTAPLTDVKNDTEDKSGIIASYPPLRKRLKPLKTTDTNTLNSSPSPLEHTSSEHDYIVPIVVTILTIPMLVVLVLFLYKKGSEFWERRHYRRMDFLIDGMYND